MKRKFKRNKGNLSKRVKEIIVGTGMVVIVSLGLCYELNKGNLTDKDFENANWLPYHNPNGRIWSCYTSEEINHNQANWAKYQEKVNEKNHDYLEGMIYLPDLDGDGKIGKIKR